MSDIRTLLDESTRRTPHPDPVGAVRETVRRRARRTRLAGAATGVAAALVAGLLVVSVRGGGDVPPTTPAPSGWRQSPGRTAYPSQATGLGDLLRDNPTALLWLGPERTPARPYPAYVVGLAAGESEDVWKPRVAAAMKMPEGARWRLVTCPEKAAHYDRIAADVLAARWPSGRKVLHRELTPDACGIHVVLSEGGDAGVDTAFARERWGGDVTLTVRHTPGTIGQPFRPSDDGVDDPRDESMLSLTELVGDPTVFVGLDVEGERIVVVFGRDANPHAWTRYVAAAAAPYTWTTVHCAVTHAELTAAMVGIERLDYPSGARPAFGAFIDAKTCTVTMETGKLDPRDLAALQDEFGDLLTIDQTGAPRRD